MRWIALLLAMLAFSGCLSDDNDDSDDNGGDNGGENGGPDATYEEVVMTAAGPFVGCEGATVPCIGFTNGPDGLSPDGYWFEVGEELWDRPFVGTGTLASGDTDCFIATADGTLISNAHNGPDACGGKLPVDAGYIFLYSYVEPSMGFTLTFPASE